MIKTIRPDTFSPVMLRALRYVNEAPCPFGFTHAIHFGAIGAEIWNGNAQFENGATKGLGMNASKIITRLEKIGLVRWSAWEENRYAEEHGASAHFYFVTDMGLAILAHPATFEILSMDWKKRLAAAKKHMARDGAVFASEWQKAINSLCDEAEKYGYSTGEPFSEESFPPDLLSPK